MINLERFNSSSCATVTPGPALAAAALAGLLTAVAGGLAGYHAIYYAAIFGLILAGTLVALTRPEPLRFAFLALIACFPIVDMPIPPRRLGIRVFDGVMVALAVGLIVRKLFLAPAEGGTFFPTRSLSVAWLLFVVCAAFSLYPLISLQALVVSLGVYVFFLFVLEELRREGGFERLVALWSIALMVMAFGLFVDYFLHVDLSLRGANLNQVTYLEGREIRRAGGFFQDPQKAGDFLACMIAFLLPLAVRRRFAGGLMRCLVWTAIVVSATALLTTASRSAIVACLFVSATALLAFNSWNPGAKILVVAGALAAAMALLIMPADVWLNLVPNGVAARFRHLNDELQIRRTIWFDTWEMFAKHPITGIGPAGFRSYLIETRPGIANYYSIGAAQGTGYVPEQPENGYLTILYECGVLGAAASLLIVADALRRAVAVLARGRSEPPARTEAIAALAGLMTFGVTFLTLFTIGDARLAALCLFFLAVIWHRSLQGESNARAAQVRPHGIRR